MYRSAHHSHRSRCSKLVGLVSSARRAERPNDGKDVAILESSTSASHASLTLGFVRVWPDEREPSRCCNANGTTDGAAEDGSAAGDGRAGATSAVICEEAAVSHDSPRGSELDASALPAPASVHTVTALVEAACGAPPVHRMHLRLLPGLRSCVVVKLSSTRLSLHFEHRTMTATLETRRTKRDPRRARRAALHCCHKGHKREVKMVNHDPSFTRAALANGSARQRLQRLVGRTRRCRRHLGRVAFLGGRCRERCRALKGGGGQSALCTWR